MIVPGNRLADTDDPKQGAALLRQEHSGSLYTIFLQPGLSTQFVRNCVDESCSMMQKSEAVRYIPQSVGKKEFFNFV